jgi:gamma-glutamylcyclotransferase (GGCT)/AIG2-like uncharacterized protein YtfP
MDVFVYGTLTDPERVAAVVEGFAFVGGAVCRGLHPVEGRYPTLVPGGEVAGRLLRVDEAGLSSLDRYEGVGSGLYVRVAVPYAGEGADEVAMYVGDPDRLDAPGGWPGDGPFRRRVCRHVDDAGVTVAPLD